MMIHTDWRLVIRPVLICGIGIILFAQERPLNERTLAKAFASTAFEAAAIKTANPDFRGMLITYDKGRQFTTVNTSLRDLITLVYRVHARQIIGGPEWLDREKYDITAVSEAEGQPSQQQQFAMMRSLLAERFGLVVHREKGTIPCYLMTIARSGSKLTKSAGNVDGPPNFISRGVGHLEVKNATLTELASTMQRLVLDRPVMDETELTGRFDLTLDWAPDDSQYPKFPRPWRDSRADALPTLFTAMQEQAGLRITGSRTSADVLVIDRAEPPSIN